MKLLPTPKPALIIPAMIAQTGAASDAQASPQGAEMAGPPASGDIAGGARNDIVTGPGGKQIPLIDPVGNIVELFQPAR